MPILETREGKNLPTWTTMNVNHTNVIDRFDKAYHFLSNFYRVPIVSPKTGRTFPSVENAYQWAKASYAHDETSMARLADAKLTASEARQLGALVVGVPEGWGQMRVKVMARLLAIKFAHAGLAGQLRKTRGSRLVEGNYWHDNYWGICSCRECPGHGQNILGRQLEALRDGHLAPPPSSRTLKDREREAASRLHWTAPPVTPIVVKPKGTSTVAPRIPVNERTCREQTLLSQECRDWDETAQAYTTSIVWYWGIPFSPPTEKVLR